MRDGSMGSRPNMGSPGSSPVPGHAHRTFSPAGTAYYTPSSAQQPAQQPQTSLQRRPPVMAAVASGASPAYTATSPAYTAASPASTAASPAYRQTSPAYRPTSPAYTPASPAEPLDLLPPWRTGGANSSNAEASASLATEAAPLCGAAAASGSAAPANLQRGPSGAQSRSEAGSGDRGPAPWLGQTRPGGPGQQREDERRQDDSQRSDPVLQLGLPPWQPVPAERPDLERPTERSTGLSDGGWAEHSAIAAQAPDVNSAMHEYLSDMLFDGDVDAF